MISQVGTDNSEKYKSYFTERCIAGAGSDDDDDDNYKTINNIINLDLLLPSVAKICTKFFIWCYVSFSSDKLNLRLENKLL